MRSTDPPKLPWEVKLEGPEGAPPPLPPSAKKVRPKRPKQMARRRKKPASDREATIAKLVEVAGAAVWLYQQVVPLIKKLKQKQKGKTNNERKRRPES